MLIILTNKVRKSIINILAEKNRAINQNRYKWAFGSGTDGNITVIPCDGKIRVIK